MYVCTDCGGKFCDPYILRERLWHPEVGCYEPMCFSVCPDCGSEDFDDFDEEE